MRLVRVFDRLRSSAAAFAHDLLMVPVAWMAAYFLRFELGPIPEPYLSQAQAQIPLLLVVQGIVFWYFGLYRGVWRFASMPDLQRIVKAVVVGVALSAVGIFLVTRMAGVPRSVPLIYAILLPLLLGGPRIVYRWVKDHSVTRTASTRAIIIGAGHAGEMLAHDILRDRSSELNVVGFVDDRYEQKGREIHGVRVLGACKNIPRYVRETSANLLLIAIPSATSTQMRRIVELCERTGVAMRTLPRLEDRASGPVTATELREIAIEDLLGREPVELDWRAITRGVHERIVLVTGGGGSIGSELCRQLAALGPRALIVFDQSEHNLYTVERQLRATWPELALHAVLGDVCDEVALEALMRTHAPEVVFHAAAYKHVPMLEGQIREAARNNVVGTRNAARAAVAAGCRTFVLISSDKAVNPTNVMGASKRLAESVCQDLDARTTHTAFITVRFGNVLDSAGSVVPLFREQIANGGPVTVTHPEVTRYFMTIPEACQLIMQAGAIGKGGEVFVLDMGEPVGIGYLARQMVLLAGKVPDQDIEIRFIGLRPGEKLFEELFHPSESLTQTPHEKLLLARPRAIDRRALDEGIAALERACSTFDEPALRALLPALVPEYSNDPQTQGDNVIQLDKVKR